MRRPLVIYDSVFPYIWGKFVFLFISVPAAEREERLREEESSSILLLLSMRQVRAKTISMWASLHLFIVGIFLSQSHQPESVNYILWGKSILLGVCIEASIYQRLERKLSLKFVEKSRRIFSNNFYFYFVEVNMEDFGDPAAGGFFLFFFTTRLVSISLSFVFLYTRQRVGRLYTKL